MFPVKETEPIVIAHRGGGAEAPENSREAFEALRKLKVRHIETDAHLSSDGIVVINHDARLDRTFHASGFINQFTWSELSRMKGKEGQRLLRLDEALRLFPDMYFNIDAKTDEVAEPLVDVISHSGVQERVLLASFSEKRLRRIRKMLPGITTSLGTSAVIRLVAAAQTHSTARNFGVPGPEDGVRAVQVPENQGFLRIVDHRFIATAHSAGLAVHVWTVNDPRTMRRLLDLGVDGLVTDVPTTARQILNERSNA